MSEKTVKEFMEELKSRRHTSAPINVPQGYIKQPTKVTMQEVQEMLLDDLKQSINSYELTTEIQQAIQTYFKQIGTKKGLMLQGNFGSGKTELLKGISRLTLRVSNLPKFRVISAHDIVTGYEARGDEYLITLNRSGIAIDDFGSEKISFRYQKEDVLIRFLETRYNLRASFQTHISTNLTSSEITERYGERIESRLHEMVTRCVVGGGANSKDFRKK
jgi:DNA replication protein DnaC